MSYIVICGEILLITDIFFLQYNYCSFLMICNIPSLTSLSPTIGGSNPGLRAELIHSLKEEVSVICGCALVTHPSAFASISVSTSLIVRSSSLNLFYSK